MADGEQSSSRDVVVIGGSAGSLSPLRGILSALPADFPALIFCVQHLSPAGRAASDALQSSLAIRARTGEDHVQLEPGVAYFAPPDRHLVIDGNELRVLRGPRENNARPSIDVLFRSAAVTFKSRVIAVLLSGTQSDGVLGLSAVQRCGGITIVHEPTDASSPELPSHALRETSPDHVSRGDEIAPLLLRLCASNAPASPPVPKDLLVEANAAAAAMSPPEVLGLDVGKPMHLTCPDCDGPVWRLNSPGPADFRCEVGHGFNLESLLAGQSRSLERALWVAFRTLKERGVIIEQLAQSARERGYESSARSFDQRRTEVEEHAKAIHGVLTSGWAEALAQPPDDDDDESRSSGRS
jgi:two-component system, chemotaxis family, protein-glutamate methylesterase/glutaminase